MPPKNSDPNKPKSVRRPKAEAPAPTPEPVEEVLIGEMTDQLRAINETIPDDVRATITGLLANNKAQTACRKWQDAANDSGAPEFARAEQRAACLAIATAYVLPEGAAPFVADDSGGEDDSYEVKPAPKRTGKIVIGKRHIDREVAINESQLVQYSKELAKCNGAITDIKNANKVLRAKMKKEEDDAAGNWKRLSDIVEKGVEVRDVIVVIQADYDLNVVREIDEATGECIGETRPLRPEEMQVPLIPQSMLDGATGATTDGTNAEGSRSFGVLDGGKGDEEQEDDGEVD